MVAPILYVMSTFRKLLLSLLLVSLTGSAFGAGTFASFTASTTNASSTFASGTVILENTKAGSSGSSSGTCFSTAAGFNGATNTDTNANAACDNLFAFSAAKPGDSVSANLTLKNGGSVAASTIEGVVTACTATAVGTYSGSTPSRICAANSGLQIQVQEHSTNAFNTPVAKCLYPVKAAACGTDYGFLGGFTAQTYGNASFLAAGLASGASKYLTVTVLFPNNGSTGAGVTDNMLMGLQAAFSITWNVAQ